MPDVSSAFLNSLSSYSPKGFNALKKYGQNVLTFLIVPLFFSFLIFLLSFSLLETHYNSLWVVSVLGLITLLLFTAKNYVCFKYEEKSNLEFTNQAQLFRFLYDKQFKRSMKSQLKAKFSDLPAFKQVSDLDIIGFLNNHTRPNVLFYQLVYFIINVLAYSGFVGFCFIFMLKFSDNCALYGCSQLLALFFFSAPILLLIVSLSYDYGAITLLLSPDFCIYEVITTRRKYIGYLRTETKTEIILRSFYVDATKGLPDNLTAHPTELVIPKTQIIHIEKHFLNPK